MKHLKNTFLLIFALLAFSSAGAAEISGPSAIEEIKEILQSSFFDYGIEEDTEVLISFMLNENNEVVIFSTSVGTLDEKIRNVLSDHVIEATDLERGRKYLLPLSIERS